VSPNGAAFLSFGREVEAFFVVNIPDVAGKFSDIRSNACLRPRDVVADKLLDRRPSLNDRSIDPPPWTPPKMKNRVTIILWGTFGTVRPA